MRSLTRRGGCHGTHLLFDLGLYGHYPRQGGGCHAKDQICADQNFQRHYSSNHLYILRIIKKLGISNLQNFITNFREFLNDDKLSSESGDCLFR